jgi:hypothetical protein
MRAQYGAEVQKHVLTGVLVLAFYAASSALSLADQCILRLNTSMGPLISKGEYVAVAPPGFERLAAGNIHCHRSPLPAADGTALWMCTELTTCIAEFFLPREIIAHGRSFDIPFDIVQGDMHHSPYRRVSAVFLKNLTSYGLG